MYICILAVHSIVSFGIVAHSVSYRCALSAGLFVSNRPEAGLRVAETAYRALIDPVEFSEFRRV
jgi:hypothetical protein